MVVIIVEIMVMVGWGMLGLVTVVGMMGMTVGMIVGIVVG